MDLSPEFWTELPRKIGIDLMAWLPALAGALALLILGWVVARIVQAALAGLLQRLGLDRLAKKAGAPEMLSGAGMEPSISGLVGRIGFWLVLLVFVLAAVESLGLEGLAGTMGGLVVYVPRVIAAGFIVLVGSLIAAPIGDAIGALASQSDARTGPFLGQAIRVLVLIIAVILAVDQLGVSTRLLTGVVVALIAAVALALALAFGLGCRELARNIMSGFHAKDEFSVGDHVKVRHHIGRLSHIGTVTTVIETAGGRVSLPNSALTDEEVEVIYEPRAGE